MRIPVNCNACGRDFTASEAFVGRRVACPGCGKSLRVKNSGAAAPGDEDERPKSGTISRRARRGPPPQVVLTVVGIVAAVIVVGMVLNNLPALTQLASSLAGPPASSPGDAAPNPSPPPAVPQPVPQPEDPAAGGYAPVPSNNVVAKTATEEREPPREKPKPSRPSRPSRSEAVAELGTDRGMRLFADLKEVVFTQENGAKLNDPRGAIGKRVAARSKVTIEKLGLEYSTGRPDSDAAVLKVTLSMKPFKKGTPGTQELLIVAELTCADPDAEDNQAYYATVWKKHDSLGTVTPKSLKTGKVPKSMDERLTGFFGSFRSDYSHALKTMKDAPLAETESDSEPAPDADSEDAEMEAETETEDDSDAETEK